MSSDFDMKSLGFGLVGLDMMFLVAKVEVALGASVLGLFISRLVLRSSLS